MKWIFKNLNFEIFDSQTAFGKICPVRNRKKNKANGVRDILSIIVLLFHNWMKWMLTCFSFSAHSIGDTNYSCTSSIRTDQLDAICYLNSLEKTSWSIRWIETLNNTFYGYKQGILFDFNLSNRQVQVHSGSNSWHIEQWFICCIDNTSIELMCVWVHHKFHLLRMIWLFCGRIFSLLVIIGPKWLSLLAWSEHYIETPKHLLHWIELKSELNRRNASI